jgi:hypothetical protein
MFLEDGAMIRMLVADMIEKLGHHIAAASR